MKKIKNNKQNTDTWVGMQIQPNSYYEIQQTELSRWQNDSKVLTDIANSDLIVNNGTSDILDVGEAINYLLDGDNEIRDADSALMVRTKMAPLGWTYHAHFFELETSKLNSLYDKKSDDTNWAWCTLKFYNSQDQEITDQTTLDTDCVKTVLDWEPPLTFELIGGEIRAMESPSSDIRLWVIGAPDIPVNYGGSKDMISGVNFKYLEAKQALHTDGRVSKRMEYNSQDHRGKMRFIIKHGAGIKLQISVLIEGYKA